MTVQVGWVSRRNRRNPPIPVGCASQTTLTHPTNPSASIRPECDNPLSIDGRGLSMSSPSLTAEDPRTVVADRSKTTPLPHPIVLGLISGCLLWLSFPPAEWSWSAWFALVPLFLLVESGRSRWAGLPRRLGRRVRLLAPGDPLDLVDRPDGLAGLGRDGLVPLALVARRSSSWPGSPRGGSGCRSWSPRPCSGSPWNTSGPTS